MTRLGGIVVSGAVALIALTAAQRPAALAQTAGGLWEVSGVPGSKAPAQLCVADVALLARFEHRSKSCTSNITSSSESTATFDYQCAGAEFGHTKMKVITPRNLRIETQGISDNLPFNYVLQARRVGDCPAAAPATASRH